VSDGKLKEKFPRLYGISVFKDRMVSDFGLCREIRLSRVFCMADPVKEGTVWLGERFGEVVIGTHYYCY